LAMEGELSKLPPIIAWSVLRHQRRCDEALAAIDGFGLETGWSSRDNGHRQASIGARDAARTNIRSVQPRAHARACSRSARRLTCQRRARAAALAQVGFLVRSAGSGADLSMVAIER
jgi:hypothetical protein